MIEVILNDWPGWLLIFVSFYITIRFRKKWKDDHLTLALCFVLAMHHVVALINTYLFTIHGADADANRFHRLAVEWVASGKLLMIVGAEFYQQLLGIFYRIFSPSHLFGEELSIIAFLFSCFVLIKLIHLMNLKKYQVGLLLMFGLLPTNLVLCSVTLRESYQILFFMLSVYWGLRFHLESTKGAMVFCVFSALIMGFFHRALILYMLFLLPVLFLWFPKQVSSSPDSRCHFSKKRFIVFGAIIILIIGILIMGILLEIEGLDALTSVFSGKGLKYAVDFRTRLMFEMAPDSRANYGIMLDTSSLGSLIKTTALVYIYYLFAPFPWQITNWLDVYAFVESLLRFILILLSIISWYRSEGLQRSIWGLLLIIYFSMTLLWSTGTVNYGTSIRHHLLTNWIIVILGGSELVEHIGKPLANILQKHKFIREVGKNQIT
jgi:hypothetical protein